MKEDKKAKLEKCAVLKANGGRCYVDERNIVYCDYNAVNECTCAIVCNLFQFEYISNCAPSPELIAARLAAVAEYEQKCAEPEKPLLLKDDTEKMEAMKNGAVYVDEDGFKIGFDKRFYFETPSGEKEKWTGVENETSSNWALKTPAQPRKLTTPTRDQLLTWVCSADALGWVVSEYLDYLDMTMTLSVHFCDYSGSIDSYLFSRTSPIGEYIWHLPMWDSVAGKIVMVPVEE